MPSINNFKGYDKVSHNNIEKQNTRPTTAVILIVTSAILVLTLIITLTLATSMLEEPIKDKDTTDSVESIKTICNVTPYPDSCFAALSPLNASKSPDPEAFLDLSLRVSITHLSNLSSSFRSLNDLHPQPALKDCMNLFDDALSRLNDPVSATKDKMSDIQTWVSAAMSDHSTCTDGLEEMGWMVGDEVKSEARSFQESVSNSLAIVANMQNLVQKLGLTKH